MVEIDFDEKDNSAAHKSSHETSAFNKNP